MVIFDERAKNIKAIDRVTLRAFQDEPHSDGTEHLIIHRLRQSGALVISLVAVQDEAVVGHVAFSQAFFTDGSPRWYALGPLSVLPELQRKGIGSALVQAGLDRLREIGAAGCVLVGHPDYYGRFGFVHPSSFICEGVPTNALFALPFSNNVIPSGLLSFHEAFFTRSTSSC